MPANHLLDSLDRANGRATTCMINLQDANRHSSATQSILLINLIATAARLRDQIAELRAAIHEDIASPKRQG